MSPYRYPVGTVAIRAVCLKAPLPRAGGLPPAMADVAIWEALAPIVAMPAAPRGAAAYEVAA